MCHATLKTWLMIIAATGLAACGSGGGDDQRPAPNLPPPPPAPPPTITGVFKDRNVSGLTYLSGQESGITDADGRYTCESGEQLSFSIGGVALGEAACSTLTTPNQLVALDNDFALQLTNMARFLQMLDIDGDPDNGIVISDSVQQVAEGWSQVDFRTMNLADELVTIISDAASVDGTPHTLPSETASIAHLQDTLACAYAGAYSGRFDGTNSGAAGMVIGWGAPSFGFIPLGFQWQGVDSVNDFIVFGGGGGSIAVLDFPIIEHTEAGLAGPIAASFVTPDRVTGTWEGGTLELNRIGIDNGGEFRFVGRADSADVAAYISLNLTGDRFDGEAFDVIEGAIFTVTGSLAGDAVTLSVSGNGESLSGTGTLERNAEGSPREIQGTLSDGSSYSIAACRLN